MTNEKLKEIIQNKNEDLEREAAQKAERIIDEIGRLTSNIANAQSQIKELQKELRALEIIQLNPIHILGE